MNSIILETYPVGRFRRFIRMMAEALISSVKSRQREREFEAIVKRHAALIARICFSYSVSSEDYEDLRQDVLVNIWRGLKQYRAESSLVTWIYRVALNTCVSTIRKSSRRPKMSSLESLVTDVAADDDAAIRERLEVLHSLIAALTPLDKAIVTMWLDERSYEEIASVTGIARNAVGVRLHRIKKEWTGKGVI